MILLPYDDMQLWFFHGERFRLPSPPPICQLPQRPAEHGEGEVLEHVGPKPGILVARDFRPKNLGDGFHLLTVRLHKRLGGRRILPQPIHELLARLNFSFDVGDGRRGIGQRAGQPVGALFKSWR
jgi:hypothetical protein